MDLGNVTLNQLSKITDRNNAKAAQLGLNLSWQIMDGYVVARIYAGSVGGAVKNFESNKHFHLILIEIQRWFWEELTSTEELFNVAPAEPVKPFKLKWVAGKGFVRVEE